MENTQQFNETEKYTNWQDHLKQNQIKINDVQELYVHHAQKDGSILYALLKVDGDTPEGTKLNPICFLKGDAVSILVVLIDEQTNDKYVLLVKQRRICDGSYTYEHPAGMIDEGEYSPVEVAAREVGEEVQLEVTADDLKPLFDKPLFSATATSDEALHFFYVERRMPLVDIQALSGRSTGAEGENEHTKLHVATFPEAHKMVTNIHGVMSHLLYLKEVGDFETLRSL